MTPSMKLKRPQLQKKYQKQIDKVRHPVVKARSTWALQIEHEIHHRYALCMAMSHKLCESLKSTTCGGSSHSVSVVGSYIYCSCLPNNVCPAFTV